MAETSENPRPDNPNNPDNPDYPDLPPAPVDTAEPASRRRRPDVPLLLAALVSLAVAVLALVGWMPTPPGFDLRWLLAGAVIVIGLVLLATSARPRPRRTRR